MTESFFPISNDFMWEKNIENTQFLTLSIEFKPHWEHFLTKFIL